MPLPTSKPTIVHDEPARRLLLDQVFVRLSRQSIYRRSMQPPERSSGPSPGARDPLYDSALQAFFTIVLLTGSTSQAENAVLQTVWTRLCESSPESIFFAAVSAALRAPDQPSGTSIDDLSPTAASLPRLLRPVLRLTRSLRHCFVLTVLVGLRPEVCGELLGLDALEVRQRTTAAFREWFQLHRGPASGTPSPEEPGWQAGIPLS